ncbi:TonB-dependent receptor [Patiriisocius hiemis]|uniref:TonB-dependent receptor n=1 Tax=Patiriisocius hiemis TaxID=3075604 RepID=A0ABU2YCC7_9FLAO|nr:TonB-dependent receptor [Constantimarinum sp. W242]MDT0554698.1 TonB-dependent receptor [Constantimarinum sp. W242]
MMKLKDCNMYNITKRLSFLLLFFWLSLPCFAQFSITGKVLSKTDNSSITNAEVFLTTLGISTKTDASGNFSFNNLSEGSYTIAVFSFEYEVIEKVISISENTTVVFELPLLAAQLSEVVITKRKEKIFALKQLRQVEGTAVYAGKKSEVVVVDNLVANLAVNAPRQVYSQVVGLNIYENGDAGLQLNIGGRGLDPNRSANFNIRQNNYDISADVLGYPESYYTPPAEALQEIQIVRGAASLQYGTQFGGLINFKMKRPNPTKKIEWTSRQTLGSYNLITSFNSLSGTVGDFSYYTYFNYKEGDGWRDNSNFSARNYFAHVGYQLSSNTKIEGELTLFNYLAQQAGGLTDVQFNENPSFTNRDRNWFDIDWKVYSLRLEHKFSSKTNASFQVFGLDATRSAVGFRQNRVSQPDDNGARELLVDNFSNWGLEGRVLTRYNLFNDESILLLGSKYYNAENDQRQGPGSDGVGPDFTFQDEEFPNFERQASFTFPNKNLAFFAENVFNISNKFSVTPGIRWEKIKTESEGFFKNIVLDLAGNVILNEEIPDNRTFDRDFFLLGLGTTYKVNKSLEVYANLSQNYRSVTFNDIRIVNPSFVIDENIKDEEGFTMDFGTRGTLNGLLSYDVSVFGLRYDDRLGEVLFEDTDGSIKRKRGNIGDAFIYGLEFFADWNIQKIFFKNSTATRTNFFTNLALTNSEYLASEESNVVGNKVEFIPTINLKTGATFGFKNWLASLQYSYIGEQFTDATNAPQDVNDNQRGIEGSIPAYGVLDFSTSYTYKKWKLEAGVSNLFDESYFTRRATGYPGPGIIPAEPITFYTTLQFKL